MRTTPQKCSKKFKKKEGGGISKNLKVSSKTYTSKLKRKNFWFKDPCKFKQAALTVIVDNVSPA